jgi:hypothetical protein
MRAEVVRYKCRLFTQCTTVRFVNEVGNGDVFVYRGTSLKLTTGWTGFQSFHITCQGCAADKVQLKRTEMDYVTISY